MQWPRPLRGFSTKADLMGWAWRGAAVFTAVLGLVLLLRGCMFYMEMSELNDRIDFCDDSTSGRYIVDDSERAAYCDQ